MATEPSDNEEEGTSRKCDVIGHLPLEIAQKILFQLSAEDLYSATSCCLSWKNVLSCDFFWERLCQREGYLEVEEPNRSKFYSNFLNRYNYWQGVYWYNHTLQRNWETNNFSEVIYEIDNPNYKCSRWLFDDVFVYTSEDSTKLNVYYMYNKEITTYAFSLDGCFNGSLSKSGRYLIYFMYNNLTVWNLENRSTIHHKHDAYDFHVYKHLILLTIVFEKFEVFNIETEQIEYCLPFEPGQMSLNNSFMDGRIIFTTIDDVIHVLKWDDKSLVTFTCCNEWKETEDHKLMVKSNLLLSFCKRHRSYGVYHTFLCVWNITTMTKLHSTYLEYSLENMTFMNECIFFKNYVYEQSDMVDIVLWDYKKKTEEAALVSKFKRSTPDVYISNDYVMILPHSFILKMWCLSKKDFICDLNFIPDDYTTYCDVQISKTKLICAILPTENDHNIKLYVRDFEI